VATADVRNMICFKYILVMSQEVIEHWIMWSFVIYILCQMSNEKEWDGRGT
jgi:hypothetical protein